MAHGAHIKGMEAVRTHIIRALRTILVAALALTLGAACSNGQPSTFNLTAADTDSSYWCPGGANNAPYDVHATVDVHNGTSSPVTIKSMTAQMTLEAINGAWLEKVGSTYDAENISFAPGSVGARSNATLKVTIPSACTSAKYGASTSSYGDYRVTLHVTTSTGSYSVTASNLHRILGA